MASDRPVNRWLYGVTQLLRPCLNSVSDLFDYNTEPAELKNTYDFLYDETIDTLWLL